jgi:hypothetical protein
MSTLGQKQKFHRKKSCPLYPQKADMCGALDYVCFGPEADIGQLLDHLVGAGEQCGWDS